MRIVLHIMDELFLIEQIFSYYEMFYSYYVELHIILCGKDKVERRKSINHH